MIYYKIVASFSLRPILKIKMYTNQLNNTCNGVFLLAVLPKYASLQVLFKIFAHIFSVVIYKEVSKFYELVFPIKPFSGGC